MNGFAWVTLATNDSYALGALVLAHSLRRVNTEYDLVILITPGVTQSMREKLLSVFTLTREVNILDSKDEANLSVLQRPELGITFTKLHCWKLTEYEKCVFLDADTLVIRNCDDMFTYEEFSAAPDIGWPDCFNSGVFVFKPSEKTFNALITFAAIQGSFDGADQGLLNMYFSDWAHKDISKHLPFIYNTCSTATYSYFAAFQQYGRNIKIIHFIGTTKPWLLQMDPLRGIVKMPAGSDHLQQFLQLWWKIFHDKVQPELTEVMVTPRDNFYHKTEKNQEFWEYRCASQKHEDKIFEVRHKKSLYTYNNDRAKRMIGDKERVCGKLKEYNQSDHQNCYTNNYSSLGNQDKQVIYPISDSHRSPSCHLNNYERFCSNKILPNLQVIDSNMSKTLLTHLNCTDLHTIGIDLSLDFPDHTKNQLENRQPQLSTTQASPQHSNHCGPLSTGSKETDGLAGTLSKLNLTYSPTDEQIAIEDHVRKQNWEQGQVDFMGQDSFDNILKKINYTLSSVLQKQNPISKETEKSNKKNERQMSLGQNIVPEV